MFYAIFHSPQTEQKIADQLQNGAIWVEASGRSYDPTTPHPPGCCWVPHDKEADKAFHDFIEYSLKSCTRYYSVSGRERVWKTLYVEERPGGQKTYHLFYGFTYD